VANDAAIACERPNLDSPVITVKNLSLEYQSSRGNWRVLSNLEFELSDGEFVALMGANGSGKTTLARCLNGILQPTNGRVLVDGLDTADAKNLIEIHRRVGLVFQHPDNQLVAPTVEREIAFGLENLGLARDIMHRRVDDMLQRFDLEPYRRHAPHQLSGGEKQRLALASIVAMQPPHIVFDEPTSLLDHPSRVQLFQTIDTLRADREAHGEPPTTIVLITQFPEEALFAERLMVLHQGEVIMDGPPLDLFQRVDEFQDVGLLPPIEFRAHRHLKSSGQFTPPIEELIVSPIL